MSVVLSNEEVSACTRELKIEVPGPAVEADRAAAQGQQETM